MLREEKNRPYRAWITPAEDAKLDSWQKKKRDQSKSLFAQESLTEGGTNKQNIG